MTVLVRPTYAGQINYDGDHGWSSYPNHRGQDYYWLGAQPSLSQEIYAAHSGTVVSVYGGGGYNGGWGNRIVIKSHNGRTESGYAHIRNGGIKVSVGDTVSAGQLIAHMGSTGESGGIHLHLDLYIDGERMMSADAIEYWFWNDLPGTSMNPTPAVEGEFMYSFVPEAGTDAVFVVSLITGRRMHIRNPYELGLLDRVRKNSGGDKMYMQEVDIVQGYLTVINPPAAIDLDGLVAKLAKADDADHAAILAAIGKVGTVPGANADQIAKAVEAILKDDYAALPAQMVKAIKDAL